MSSIRTLIVFIILYSFQGQACIYAQQESEDQYFEQLSKIYPKLNQTIRIDMQGLTLYELITTIADENGLNVSADFNLDALVDSNFYDITIKDLFEFLTRRYSLKTERINGVLVFTKKDEPLEPLFIPEKPLDITYDSGKDLLSINFKNDSLQRVARALTDLSGHNIILSQRVKKHTVSAYILNKPFNEVLQMFASSNLLELTIDEKGFYLIDKSEEIPDSGNVNRVSGNRKINSNNRGKISGNLSIKIDNSGFLDLEATDLSATDMIQEVSDKINVNYFMFDKPDDVRANLTASGVTFEEMLDNILEGTAYTYKKENNLYLIGKHKSSGIRETELIQLENRTVEKLSETLPQSLTQNLEIKEFWDLNGFIVSGSRTQINEFRDYIKEIDQVVPVVQIEVLIVQYQKGYEINTGIQLGLDSQKRTTSGVLIPSTDVTLDSNTVNDLIDAFNGLGWLNLGKVTQEFYASLRAMENNSIINITSTPKLVTLNGHQASSSIGETNYYFEQNNRLINSGINDNILQSGVWKATDANLSVNIMPFVSKDEQITLKIKVEKNSFLGRAGENAPPGKATQSFESIVRVRNNEMVLLGGLDELERENSGTGAPLLSRIPVIKWFFSNRVKKRQKSKLHLFIKPTVIY